MDTASSEAKELKSKYHTKLLIIITAGMTLRLERKELLKSNQPLSQVENL
jgi:hypothetical protein